MNCLMKIDNFVLSDFLDLVHPEAVEEARNRIIGALQSYEMSKSFILQQTILAGKEFSLLVILKRQITLKKVFVFIKEIV